VASANRNCTPTSKKRFVISNNTLKCATLLSGGDAWIFSDDKLEKILSRLRAIPHRISANRHARSDFCRSARAGLCAMLAKYHPLWMSVHVNHPRELTIEVKEALERLANHGIPLGNQSVLLSKA
jgi:lysine 2,3-aminomutase